MTCSAPWSSTMTRLVDCCVRIYGVALACVSCHVVQGDASNKAGECWKLFQSTNVPYCILRVYHFGRNHVSFLGEIHEIYRKYKYERSCFESEYLVVEKKKVRFVPESTLDVRKYSCVITQDWHRNTNRNGNKGQSCVSWWMACRIYRAIVRAGRSDTKPLHMITST
jgi:hypothetical protein